MALGNIGGAVTRLISRTGLQASKHSPTIMVGVAVVGVVGTAFLAAKATHNLEEKLYHNLEEIEDMKDLVENSIGEEKKDNTKRLTKAYLKLGGKVAIIYAPTVVAAGLTISTMVGSHRVMVKRNSALMTAYAVLDQAFAKYRSEVAEKWGDASEAKIHQKVTEVAYLDADDKKQIDVHPELSPYARLYDETNPNFIKDPSANKMFLQAQQVNANRLLAAKGHLFLNDVYEMLGLDPSPAGQLVGWIYGTGNGDDYVDFGIWNVRSESNIRFNNGSAGPRDGLWLDFNVDGVVYDLI